MREEHVTKAILQHLMDRGWIIVCYDFPQSGAGRALHPDSEMSKTRGIIVPDVVAVKDGIALYLEDKDRYCYADYVKVHKVVGGNSYRQAFSDLLAGYAVRRMVCGIGMPVEAFVGEAVINAALVDVVLGVDENGSVRRVYGGQRLPL